MFWHTKKADYGFRAAVCCTAAFDTRAFVFFFTEAVVISALTFVNTRLTFDLMMAAIKCFFSFSWLKAAESRKSICLA